MFAKVFVKNQSGSTLLTVVIGMAVILTLILAYSNTYASIRQTQARVNLLNTIAQIQLNLVNTINDSESWKSTIADSEHNSSMACLKNDSCTSAIPETQFVLWPAKVESYHSIGDAIYDGKSATAGYTLTGDSCSTFSTSGSSDCPLHVDLTYSVQECSPSPCAATVSIHLKMKYRPGSASTQTSIDENRFETTFTQHSNTSSDPCASAPSDEEVEKCENPPHQNDILICTSTGYRCGRIYSDP